MVTKATKQTDETSAHGQVAVFGTIPHHISHLSSFWRPTYLNFSAWTEHVPFAFWLLENLQRSSAASACIIHGPKRVFRALSGTGESISPVH